MSINFQRCNRKIPAQALVFACNSQWRFMVCGWIFSLMNKLRGCWRGYPQRLKILNSRFGHNGFILWCDQIIQGAVISTLHRILFQKLHTFHSKSEVLYLKVKCIKLKYRFIKETNIKYNVQFLTIFMTSHSLFTAIHSTKFVMH